jgi:peptide/nickel transport system substrate-binding protein
MLRGLRISAAFATSALVFAACSPVEPQQNGGDSGADGDNGGQAAGIETGPAAGENDLYGPPASDAQTGGTVTVASLTEPPALDPFHQAADARIQYSGLMYQGLMYESSSGTALPLLAESVDTSDDGLTYTFQLREGVTFHDGKPMTAEDVKYSYDYIRDPDNGSPGASDFQVIKEISTPDDATVEMILSEPNAALLMTLTNKYGAVIPAGYFETPGAVNKLNQVSVGTGPYKLGSLKKNSFLTLERNEDYWGEGGPYIDELVFQFMPNSAAVVVALQNDRVDMAVLPRVEDAQQLQSDEQVDLIRFPSLNHKALDLDSEYPPLDDVRVRQAIAAAIDKSVVAQAAASQQHQVIGTIVGSMQETWGLPLDEVPFQERDVEKAKELLVEAGYEDGLDIDLRIINGYDWMDPAAVVITQQLAEVGIRVKTKKLELGTWIDNFQNRQMGFTMNDWGTQPDPHMLYYRHYHQQPEGVDFRNWNNEEASKLLDEAMATPDQAERAEIYQEFQKVFGETVPTVMLYSPEWLVATNQRLQNYVHHPTGWYFGLVRAHVTD